MFKLISGIIATTLLGLGMLTYVALELSDVVTITTPT